MWADYFFSPSLPEHEIPLFRIWDIAALHHSHPVIQLPYAHEFPDPSGY